MRKPDLSVAALVVTYNRRELLDECLRALMAQDYAPERIVVIDNASGDGTDRLFSAGGEFSGIPGLLYFRMAANLGGAGGFKEGIRRCMEAGCDWIWLMDDDCIACPDTLSELVAAVPVAARYGNEPSFFASMAFGQSGEPMNVPGVDGRLTANGYADWHVALREGLVKVERATFVSLLVNARAVERVGLPISNFFIWGDDTEYTTRLTHHFGPAYLVGRSSVLHKRASAGSLDIRDEEDAARIANYRRFYRNNLVVSRYHHGRRAAAKTVLVDFCLAASCLTKSNGRVGLRFARARAILFGVFDYLIGRYDLEDLGRFAESGGR